MRLEIRLKMVLKTLLCAVALIALPACGTKTVYISPGEPCRIRQTVKAVQTWEKDAAGQMIKGERDLQEGWYVLPPDAAKSR